MHNFLGSTVGAVL